MTGLATITLGGEKRTLSFKNHFLFIIGKHLDCDPAKIMETITPIAEDDPMQAVVIIIYNGLVAYQHRIGNYSNDITFQQVSEWWDDADQEEATTVWKTFFEIMTVPKSLSKHLEQTDEKKKTASRQPGKKSTSTHSAKSA